MFGKNKGIELINHRLDNIEKELSTLNGRFANILVQRIVYGLLGAILFAAVNAMIGGNLTAFLGVG